MEWRPFLVAADGACGSACEEQYTKRYRHHAAKGPRPGALDLDDWLASYVSIVVLCVVKCPVCAVSRPTTQSDLLATVSFVLLREISGWVVGGRAMAITYFFDSIGV